MYQIKSEYTSESDSEKPRRMADLGSRKYEGIGPVSKDGMPLILRSVSILWNLTYVCKSNNINQILLLRQNVIANKENMKRRWHLRSQTSG